MFLGKDDIFGENINESSMSEYRVVGKSMYCVRALSYCDLHKIELEDLQEILDVYPEFAGGFLQKFRVTFDLRRVSHKLAIMLYSMVEVFFSGQNYFLWLSLAKVIIFGKSYFLYSKLVSLAKIISDKFFSTFQS